MKALYYLISTEEFSPLYISCLLQKAKVSQRRKSQMNGNGHNGRRTHWHNRTGQYHYTEERKGPKYWHGQRPVLVHNPIKDYHDLFFALDQIAHHGHHYQDYYGTTGINRERLRLAQSLTDRGLPCDISDIVRLNFFEIRSLLDFRKTSNYR